MYRMRENVEVRAMEEEEREKGGGRRTRRREGKERSGDRRMARCGRK